MLVLVVTPLGRNEKRTCSKTPNILLLLIQSSAQKLELVLILTMLLHRVVMELSDLRMSIDGQNLI